MESLAQYIVRGAIALERLSVTDGTGGGRTPGKVIYRARNIHPAYGANFRMFDPLDFIAHLAAHIPSRHEKRAIWYGHYSNKSRGVRRKQAAASGDAPPVSEAEIAAATEELAPLAVRRAWAYLVNKVYEVDPLVCPRCGGQMKVISHIEDSDVIFRILDHLGLLEEEPAGSSERAPPVCADALTATMLFEDLVEADHYEQAPLEADPPPTAETGELTCEPFFDDISPGEEDWIEAALNVGRVS